MNFLYQMLFESQTRFWITSTGSVQYRRCNRGAKREIRSRTGEHGEFSTQPKAIDGRMVYHPPLQDLSLPVTCQKLDNGLW